MFHYKNKTDKQIVVYEIGITKGNSNKVVKKKERKTMLKPYGISLDVLKFNDINPDIIVEPYYRCRYANILDKLFKEKLYKIPN